MRTLKGWSGADALSAFHQALVVILINIPSVSFGLALGWVSLVSGEAADEGDMGAVFAAVTTFLACFVSVPISAKIITYGRKYAVMAASACFVLCWSLKLVSVSASDGWMIGGRLAAGFGGTAAWTLAPLLAREMCSEGWCGAAVSALPLAHNAGILLMYLAADARMHHKTVIWWCLGVSAFHFFVFMFIPESPSFLAAKGKNEEARSSLAWLRGRSTDSPKLDAEFKTLPPAEQGEESSLSRVLDLFRDRQRRWAFAIGFVAVVGQEMCGILAITQYAERLFMLTRDRAAAVSIAATPEGPLVLATPARHALILGAVQLVASALSLYLVERLGRRPLIVGCAWAVGLSLGGAAGAVWAGKAEGAAVAVALAVAVDAAGLQAAPYALFSDMFAYEYRGCATMLMITGACLGNAIEVVMFPAVVVHSGVAASLLTAAALSLAYAIFTTIAVPETRLKTPEQIYDAICPAASQCHSVKVSNKLKSGTRGEKHSVCTSF
ncbi:sugar transporter ERD6-like 2 isoform X1 [Pieris napi]|uniref:sugar transporter ERD6-like 2 isoform X1 n=2 Tax=Pieris napi TaxID=78633 RepID=UPI001FB8CDE9|nr:sugar transporter ERD6-like 2 isoform X1 [Pieris napi]